MTEGRGPSCHSCHAERPIEELRHPLSLTFERRMDLWECVNAEACWKALCALPVDGHRVSARRDEIAWTDGSS